MWRATRLEGRTLTIPPMKFLDLSFDSPSHNLACDEALLDWCEEEGGEVLRFWESARPFVALGYTDQAQSECDVEECRAQDVPILRRCSGGGTVLQGPGCFNYALVLRIEPDGPTENLSLTNGWIMERHRDAARALMAPHMSTHAAANDSIEARGITDLAWNDVKFSGNAQRRKRRTLLFHGTFLLDFDLNSISTLLKMPSKQPDYRQARSHGDFICNIPLHRDAIRHQLKGLWNAHEPLHQLPQERIENLAHGKYRDDAWNFKF